MIMSEKVGSRCSRPGRGKTGISKGMVMHCLIQHLENQNGFDAERCSGYRLDLNWQGYVPRIFLTPEQAVSALKEAGVTMEQLFRESGCSVLMDSEDTRMMTLIHRLGEEELGQVLDVIRDCQDPWWIPLLDGTEVSTAERLQVIGRRRLGCYDDKAALAVKYPVLSQYTPFSKVSFIQIDDLPALAEELDVHVGSLTELGPDIPWYSDWLPAERVFAEYQMLSRTMRSMVIEFACKKLEDYRYAQRRSRGRIKADCVL